MTPGMSPMSPIRRPPIPYRPPGMYDDDFTSFDESIENHYRLVNENNPFFYILLRALFMEMEELISGPNNNPENKDDILVRMKENGISLYDFGAERDLLQDEDDQCSICLDCDVNKTTGGKLLCGHAFHTKCILPWLLNKKKTCPNCRGHIDVEELVN